jgi:hypothetical protein
MGTVVEELVKELVDEKYGRKVIEIQPLAKAVLPSHVGRVAKLCRESCHPM